MLQNILLHQTLRVSQSLTLELSHKENYQNQNSALQFT